MRPRFDKDSILTRAILLLMIIVITVAMLPGCKKKAPEPTPLSESEEASIEEPSEEQVQENVEPDQELVTEGDTDTNGEVITEPEEAALIDEDGWYYSKDEVALYVYTYGHLPDNFMTKTEAKKLGWTGGSLEKYAPGKVIGGDRFGNYEGNLPKKKGRTYTECDIDTYGQKSRGAKRIVFSNDGLIFYTDDHYETFELLYGEEDA